MNYDKILTITVFIGLELFTTFACIIFAIGFTGYNYPYILNYLLAFSIWLILSSFFLIFFINFYKGLNGDE